jgi:diketogulonate reductase-like aldo/keto reductase
LCTSRVFDWNNPFDTAAVYGNEKSVGKAIAESGLDRNDLFVTSKLFNTEHTCQKTRAAFLKTLDDLRLDYLDLYLIHWPNPIDYRNRWAESNLETWKAFEDFYSSGKIRAIGVSNFHARHLDALLPKVAVKPMVNQIRLCPGDVKPVVVKDSLERGLFIEAYSPLGGSGPENILRAPLLLELSEKYGKSTAQICVRWCLQHDFLPLPKSTAPDHIASNANVFDFEIIGEDIKRLDELEGYSDPFPHSDNITW